MADKHGDSWVEQPGPDRLVTLAEAYRPGSPEEKALVRKLDLHIIPCVWILFMLNYMDRSNIGYVPCMSW